MPAQRSSRKPPEPDRVLKAASTSPTFMVVGIGASAGGLEACRKLLSAVPARSGMALILVQHLDPNHASLMAELLAQDTDMPVLQASEGLLIEPDHLYVIPPGVYLSIVGGALHLSRPEARHGARMPFDFLLRSLATAYGPRAVGLILSGTGTDGSLGLQAVKEAGGSVIVQDPSEAAYDGMPRNAVATGLVDHVVPILKMPATLRLLQRSGARISNRPAAKIKKDPVQDLRKIVHFIREHTPHDFSAYKSGTLQRRIARRMGLLALAGDDLDRYLAVLRADPKEVGLLVDDLLINVTKFFRDPEVFERLSATIIRDMVAAHPPDEALRVWTVGCSTGEESYSLAILFREQIAAAHRNIRLQIFASDVDADAVAIAREGLYPASIAADVTPARLSRSFLREDQNYRVSPDLRACIVFTVQDVLADPPFSRLDMISCRNLLIYLRPEAQTRAISLFHFALRDAGVLLLGASENIRDSDGRFEAISKTLRLYRHAGRRRPGDVSLLNRGGARLSGRVEPQPPVMRDDGLAEICRRLVMEAHAPAAVLINARRECLFSLGPTDRYLRFAAGEPSHDLLTVAREGVRTKLRAAIQQTRPGGGPGVVTGGRLKHDGAWLSFNIETQPVVNGGEDLILICFVETPGIPAPSTGATVSGEISRVVELEQELEATRTELQGAIRNLELSSEDQVTMTEEARSVSEEYQSTNEELLTSKEELQSLNEELTALNSQLQETLERQRTTANDLQNILYSTNVATLFLDDALNIRFFTPSTRSLFNIIPTDIGRPLADLHSLAADSALLSDARFMLKTMVPREREVEAGGGAWYLRRILPYRTKDDRVEGVVITFTDITERKRSADALADAKRAADSASIAKSRFLAAASHDLRQPLQTLALLQGLLAKTVETPAERSLVMRIEQTLGAVSGMLNALLDINQIEAGTVQAESVSFPVSDILARLKDAFAYPAEAQGLGLRVIPSHLMVESDPRLLEQLLRNLVSNALKYTRKGKVLIGCRRSGDNLRIEIWDTGVGIPPDSLQIIFEEYHQLDNAARERSRGLGLGLSIVKRIADLLGRSIEVHSRVGVGSVFSVEVPMTRREAKPESSGGQEPSSHPAGMAVLRHESIMVIEDDPDVRDLLGLLLRKEGHQVMSAGDGKAALELLKGARDQPDLILADYNLPGGMDGLAVAAAVRERMGRDVPVIMLTGDISIETLREIARRDYVQLNKPVQADDLSSLIQHLLADADRTRPPLVQTAVTSRSLLPATQPVIYIVEDDAHVRDAILSVLTAEGRVAEAYDSSEAFLAAYRPGAQGCLLVDAHLPGLNGVALLERLRLQGDGLPAIVITGASDVPMVVAAMKAGARDFIEKPISGEDLLASISLALEQSHEAGEISERRRAASDRLATLTARQREVMDRVLAGEMSKNIALDLGISQRTVENHRASIMIKTGAKSLPGLARLALAATRAGAK